MTRPLMVDLYCGLGGAAMGYFLAGWDIVGVDSVPQPDYPFTFIQADITKMRIRWKRARAIHASPPCKVHTLSRHQSTNHNRQHEDLIPFTRELLEDSGLPYVIENVPTAPLIDPLTLCGSMFGLRTEKYELKRHRLFEGNWDMPEPPADRCGTRIAVSVYGDHPKITGTRLRKRDGAMVRGTIDMPNGLAYQLMGITWATSVRQFSQAIPPAYTQFLGYWLRQQI